MERLSEKLIISWGVTSPGELSGFLDIKQFTVFAPPKNIEESTVSVLMLGAYLLAQDRVSSHLRKEGSLSMLPEQANNLMNNLVLRCPD